MKAVYFIGLALLLVVGCSDEPEPGVDPPDLEGIWVTFELIYSDGTVDQGPFLARSIFGAYDEGLQFNDDGTYVPLWWVDETNFHLDHQEAGKFVSNESGLRIFEGSWDMEFSIEKYEPDELWLMYRGDIPILGGEGTLYKLRKQEL